MAMHTSPKPGGNLSLPRTLFAIVTAAALWSAACGETEPPDPPRPTTVTVSPAMAELAALAETVQLSAEVHDQDGQVMAGATVTWASSATAGATVSASGLVTAVANGSVTITAASGSASGSAEITVEQQVAEVVVTSAADTLNANLRGLGLNDNQLTGAIPAELGNLGSLENLRLEENQLTGAIPAELGDLGNLRRLYLNDNQLTGAIPREFINLSLFQFWWHNTNLCAPADEAFQNWLASIPSHFGGENCASATSASRRRD